jgi:hypothetical protein
MGAVLIPVNSCYTESGFCPPAGWHGACCATSMLKLLLVVDTADRASALKAAVSAIDGVMVACAVGSPMLPATLEEHAADVVLIHSDSLNPAVLEPIVRVAIERFEAERSLRAELEETKARLAERKLLERAKGILMKHRGMDEDEAFAALRTLAMQRGIRLGDAAQQVIDIAAMLG